MLSYVPSFAWTFSYLLIDCGNYTAEVIAIGFAEEIRYMERFQSYKQLRMILEPGWTNVPM